MGEWQPIETAPKDGNAILVCLGGDNINVVYYDDGGRPTRDHVWWMIDGDAYHRDLPTHWMPLPAPPQSGGEAGG